MAYTDLAPEAVSLTNEVIAVAAAPDQVEEEVVMRIEARRVIRLVRRKLDPIERRVITWRYGLAGAPELSLRDVAERMGTSVGTAFNTERRALEKLRGAYDEEPAA